MPKKYLGKDFHLWTKLDQLLKLYIVQLIFIIVFSSTIILNRLGEATLTGDCCYYAEQAKEMVANNSLLTMYYNNEKFFDTKPPLNFWIISAAGRVFGFNNFSARIGNSVICTVFIWLMYLILTKLFNPTVSFLTSLILLFTQQYLQHARSAQTDGLLTVWFGLALFSFWLARKKNIYYYLMGICIGLAVMTKQINGLLVYPVILIYILVAKEFKILKNPHFYLGIVLSMTIFIPWHWYSIVTYGDKFTNAYFSSVFGFVLGLQRVGPANPWWEYGKKMLENYWPWLPLLLLGIICETKNLIKTKVWGEENRFILYILCWSIVPFILLHFVSVKQNQYIVPLYPAFAMVVGVTLNRFSEKVVTLIRRYLVILTILLSVLLLIFPVFPKTLDGDRYAELIPMIPTITKLDSDIITLHEHYWRFSNPILFYGDRGIKADTIEGIRERVRCAQKTYFLFNTNEMELVKGNIFYIIERNKRYVLFSNKKIAREGFEPTTRRL